MLEVFCCSWPASDEADDYIDRCDVDRFRNTADGGSKSVAALMLRADLSFYNTKMSWYNPLKN